NIATQAVANSSPDGYTLLFTASTHTINVSLYQSLPFNFLRDITMVAGLTELPLVLEVNPSVPAKTLAELITHAKANPGKINIASFGAATISHLAIELLKSTAGIDMVHVPYRGGAALIADLIGGEGQVAVDALPNSLPHIKSGSVRALALVPPAAASRARAASHDAVIGRARHSARARNHSGLRGEHLLGRRHANRHAA